MYAAYNVLLISASDKLGQWLHDLLKSRDQTVASNAALPEEALVLSNVPPGTVLFVAFLSDVSSLIQLVFLATLTLQQDHTQLKAQQLIQVDWRKQHAKLKNFRGYQTYKQITIKVYCNPNVIVSVYFGNWY